jgi:hypothetical protein
VIWKRTARLLTSQEMDAAVQGRLATDDWELVRGAGEEGLGGAPDRLALKNRKIAMKMIGPVALKGR